MPHEWTNAVIAGDAEDRRGDERERDERDDAPTPTRPLIGKLLQAGADAGRLLLEAGQKALADNIVDDVSRLNLTTDDAVDAQVRRVIQAHIRLARSEGAAAGLATTSAEMTTFIGTAGTLTVPAAIVITATDLAGLAWIQLRMTLMIAAFYGHDPRDRQRLTEFMSLQGATPPAMGPAMSTPMARGATRVLQRLILRHLRGPALASIKSLFRVVGVKFTRQALLRQLPFVNIPINTIVNDVMVRRLGDKARRYYKDLPSPTADAPEPEN